MLQTCAILILITDSETRGRAIL